MQLSPNAAKRKNTTIRSKESSAYNGTLQSLSEDRDGKIQKAKNLSGVLQMQITNGVGCNPVSASRIPTMSLTTLTNCSGVIHVMEECPTGTTESGENNCVSYPGFDCPIAEVLVYPVTVQMLEVFVLPIQSRHLPVAMT